MPVPSQELLAPAATKVVVTRVVRLVDDLKLRDDRTTATGDPLSSLDRSAVVSVLGDAGSGKSTILHFARLALARDRNRMVLPVISPERFSTGDTVFGWVLASMQTALASDPVLLGQPVDSRGQVSSIREQLDLVRRQEALSRVDMRLAAEAAGSLTPDHLASSLAAVTTAGLELVHGWWAVLDALVSHGNVVQAVVPVDDADQNADALMDLVRDIRWVTAHPAVTVLLCGNERHLSDLLTLAPTASTAERARASQASDAVLVKALPRHLRVRVRSLTPDERLEFVPLEEDRTIREVLGSFALPEPTPVGLDNLANYFLVHVGDRRETSNYAEMLPGNPRRLQQLWHSLSAALEDTVKPTSNAALRLIEAALADAASRDARVPPDYLGIRELDDDILVQPDVSDVATGDRKGRGHTAYRSSTHFVAARYHAGFYAQPSDEDRANQAAVEFPPSFLLATRFLLDVAAPNHLPTPLFTFEGQRGTLAHPGGDNWHATVTVSVGADPPDEPFLPVPAWENFIDYLVYVRAWNSIMDSLIGLSFEVPRDDESLISFLVWFHLMLVDQIHRTRTIEEGLVPRTESEWRDVTSRSTTDEPWNAASSLLRATYMAGGDAMRDTDFQMWVASDIILIADPVFCPPSLQRRVLQLRHDVLASVPERAPSDATAANRLAARIQRNLRSAWVTESLELLKSFDPKRAGDLLHAHQLTRSERSRSDQVIADVLAERGVPDSLVGRLTLEGLTEPVADALRALGFAHQALAQLRARFPPTRLEDELDAARPPTSIAPGDA